MRHSTMGRAGALARLRGRGDHRSSVHRLFHGQQEKDIGSARSYETIAGARFRNRRPCLKPNGVCVYENHSPTELTGCKSRPVDMEAIRPGMNKTEVNYCRYSEPPQYTFSWKKTTLWSNADVLRNGFEPLRYTAKLGRCCVGAVDPRAGPYAHYSRMAFTLYGYGRMNRQLWATMTRLLCRDVRDAAIRAVETYF